MFAGFDFLTVIFPVDAIITTTMIGGQNQRRAVTVFRHRLDLLPQTSDVIVRPKCGVQIKVVATRMSPVVGFAQRHIHQSGLLHFEVLFRASKCDKVVSHFWKVARELGGDHVQILQSLLGFGPLQFQRHIRRERLPASIHRNSAASFVDNEREHVPAAKRGHRVFETRLLVHPLQHSLIGIVRFCV